MDIDVKQCHFYYMGDYFNCSGYRSRCDEHKDCCYKQLQQLKAEVKSKTDFIQEQRDIINQYSKEIEMYKKCQGKRASKREEELKVENDELKQQIFNKTLEFEGIKVVLKKYEKCLEKIHQEVVTNYCMVDDQEYMTTLLENLQTFVEEVKNDV